MENLSSEERESGSKRDDDHDRTHLVLLNDAASGLVVADENRVMSAVLTALHVRHLTSLFREKNKQIERNII